MWARVLCCPATGSERKRLCKGDSAITNAAILELLLAKAATTRPTRSSQGDRGVPPSQRARLQDRSSRDQSGRQQDRSGRQQERSGREQDRSGQHQDRSDRHQDRSDRHKDMLQLDERAERAFGRKNAGDNRDHTRSDTANDMDHPFRRYVATKDLRRHSEDVVVRQWHSSATLANPVLCQLCLDVSFLNREDWLRHADAVHGGEQRYRNALFMLKSLSPHITQGQEWRAIVSNFSEFFARGATDWEKFSEDMRAKAATAEGLGPEDRWEPRSRRACVFCARFGGEETFG